MIRSFARSDRVNEAKPTPEPRSVIKAGVQCHCTTSFLTWRERGNGGVGCEDSSFPAQRAAREGGGHVCRQSALSFMT